MHVLRLDRDMTTKDTRTTPASRSGSTALDKLSVSSLVGTSEQLTRPSTEGRRNCAHGIGTTPSGRVKPERVLPSRAGSVVSGTIPCGLPTSRGFQTEYRRKFSQQHGSRLSTQSSHPSLPGRGVHSAPTYESPAPPGATRLSRPMPHRPGTAQPPPAPRPSTSSMGRTLNQKNQESIGWAPGMANSTARQQQQQQQQRKLGPDSPHHPRLRPSTGAPPRTPVPVIAHHKAILGTRPPTTATTAAKEKPIPGRTVSAGRSPSAEETLHHPHVTQGPEASGAVCAELDPSSSGEMGTRPGESAPCTPFLPIPASDISPPRTAADQASHDFAGEMEIDLVRYDVGQNDEEPCAVSQAAPMVLNLEDLAKCTPEVLELEVENLDIHQLELLEKRILNEMSELGGTRQPQSAYGPVS